MVWLKNIYWGYESGSKLDRIDINKLLKIVVEGDTIVITELSRIIRKSTRELCEIMDIVKKKYL